MKIYDLNFIANIAAELKSNGKKIGLCHGVFDIIHAGHIDHFNEVKTKCDYLFVTITEDKYVNKGPNRPVNNHYFRAKVLDSIKQVDYVGINYSPDAVKSIMSIKPDFYFKGKDYKTGKDLTLRLQKEIQALKKISGKIIFTESQLKSSTQIINKSFSYIFDNKLLKFLSTKNKSSLLNDCIYALEGVKKLNVLMIGDAIIDQYETVKPLNKPVKENILATRYINSNLYLGGIFAAAKNLQQFNNNITICTAIGNDTDMKRHLSSFSRQINSKIFLEKNKITTRKKRFIENSYNRKISEIYYMSDDFLSEYNLKKVINYLKKNLKNFDVVILIDYGHNFINKKIYDVLVNKAKFLAINCQTNSANLGFNLISKYKRSDYVCIDEPELRLAVSNNVDEVEQVLKNNLIKKIKCKNITITRGKYGSCSFMNSKILHTPALISDKVIDTIGAGDVFLGITALLNSRKNNQLCTNLIGNIAAALKVDILGHSRTINQSDFYAILKHILK
jgi:rfaE bifunctional protein nucleotidyltransferase chain/domain